MATIIRKRLQFQPTGRRGIDKSINFVVGELTQSERRRLRGPVFHATSNVDAVKLHRDLLKMAKEAADAHQVDQFLDALDQRSRPGSNWGPQFAAFSQEWLDTCVIGSDLRESQIESDKSIVNGHLIPAFGKLPVCEIDVRRLDRYIASKRRQKHQYGVGYSPASINGHLSVLHRIFEKAIEYGHLECNAITPRMWLKRDKTAEDSREWLRPEEEQRVWAALAEMKTQDPRMYFTIATQLLTGIRFGELRALQKEDLDLTVPCLLIRRSQARKKVSTPKNKKSRAQVIPKAFAKELHAWMLSTEGQLLFPAESGLPMPNNTLNRAYTRLCAKARVRRITSHGARHTSGSSYALQGASQRMIATLLGHSNTSATERYTHVQVDATRALVEARWEGLAKGGGG